MASLAARSLTLRRLVASSSANTAVRSSSSLSGTINGNGWCSSPSIQIPAENAGQRRFLSAQTEKKKAPLPHLSEHHQNYVHKGWMDERGLTRFDTLHENQVRSCEIFAENPLYGNYSDVTGQFEFDSYEHFGHQVNRTRDVLQHLGIGKYDKIGMISNNRWEWAALACAAYSLSASIVPMYEAQLPSDWSYIANDSQCKVLFCASQEIYDQVQTEVLPSAPALQSTMCLDAPEGEPHAFATAMAQATEDTDGQLIMAPTIDDLASLIYTSGTTGKPKGVELTHNNLVTNVKSAARTMVENPLDFVNEDDRSLAFLPWAHSYGQTCELWLGIAHGGSAGICRGVPTILEDLALVKPTVLFAVPTLYKKIYDGVANVMQAANPRRKWLMSKALELGRKNSDHTYGHGPELGFVESLQFKALDKLVLSKIRDRFGGNLRYGFVAGAACPAEVIHFMDSLGIPVLEGYGLTETSPIIAINSPEQRHVGSVGRSIGGVTVFIVDEDGKEVPLDKDGEICCTGPNIMKGYYNNPSATDEVISTGPDGNRMFHTGDMGRVDAEGYVKVTGRIKELYKLENGKYVCPTPMEEAIGMSRFLAQVVLVGANRPHNVVLIVPEWATLRAEFQVDDKVTDEELANDERVKELMDAEIQMSCYNMKKFEIPTKYAFVAPFTVANDMLTPKMSIRRHRVQETYKDLIDELYGAALTTPEATTAEADKAAKEAV